MATSEAQKRASANYDAKNGRKTIGGTVYGEEVALFEEYARSKGMTPSKLVIECTRRCMILDGFVKEEE